MTKVTSNKPTKTSPLGGAALGALGNIDKQTTAINQALLTMMPASSVESTKAGNAPAIPAAEQAASTKAIKNIITELKEIQGMTALASFIAITLEADQPKDTKLVEDIAQIAQDVTKLLADPKMGAAKATLATNLDAKVGQNIVSLAKDNLDTDEQNAIDAAIPGGVFSNDGTIDISAILILMITLNAKLRKTEQDSSIATAKAQSQELKDAAKATKKAAMDAFIGAVVGAGVTIAGAASGLGSAAYGGRKQASELAQVQKNLGPEPIGIQENAPKPLEMKQDPLKLQSDEATLQSESAAAAKFTTNKKAVSNALTEASSGDGSKTYVNPENGSLTEDGLAAYETAKSDFQAYVQEKTPGTVIDKKLATSRLFDKEGKLTAVGKSQLTRYQKNISKGNGRSTIQSDNTTHILQYTPDELNQAMAQPQKAVNYLKYTQEIADTKTSAAKRSQLTKERDAIKQDSADYEKKKGPELDRIQTQARDRQAIQQSVQQLLQPLDSISQSSARAFGSSQQEAEAETDRANAQMIGATKQNIDATTQNIDSTVSAMIQLLTQYLQGVNQTASNAARLV